MLVDSAEGGKLVASICFILHLAIACEMIIVSSQPQMQDVGTPRRQAALLPAGVGSISVFNCFASVALYNAMGAESKAALDAILVYGIVAGLAETPATIGFFMMRMSDTPWNENEYVSNFTGIRSIQRTMATDISASIGHGYYTSRLGVTVVLLLVRLFVTYDLWLLKLRWQEERTALIAPEFVGKKNLNLT